MDSKTIANGILRAFFTIVAVAVFLYLLYEVKSVIAYITIAGVLSLVGAPIVRILEEKLKFKKTIAVVTTMLLLLGFFLGIIGLFIPLVIEQGQNLSLLDLQKLETNIDKIYLEFINNFNIPQQGLTKGFKSTDVLDKIDFSVIPDFLNSFISGLGSFSIGLFSVLFISFFFLKDSKLLQHAILIFIPDEKEDKFVSSTPQIRKLLSRYFVGLIIQITILFVIYTIGLLIVGVKSPIVIAFLCALLNLIPYVGPVIGAALMLTLTMTSNLGNSFVHYILPKTFWVLIIFLIGQLVDNFFSQPLIFSKSVKSHPLEIFLIILIAGILFGVIGLIIAIPAYTALRVILKAYLADNEIIQKITKDI